MAMALTFLKCILNKIEHHCCMAASGEDDCASGMLQVTGVQAWLKDGCRAAIAAAKAGKAANWDAVRADTFPPSSENMYGDLRLIDFSDRVAAIPQEEARVRPPSQDSIVLQNALCQSLEPRS